jgi:hypothetical protein
LFFVVPDGFFRDATLFLYLRHSSWAVPYCFLLVATRQRAIVGGRMPEKWGAFSLILILGLSLMEFTSSYAFSRDLRWSAVYGLMHLLVWLTWVPLLVTFFSRSRRFLVPTVYSLMAYSLGLCVLWTTLLTMSEKLDPLTEQFDRWLEASFERKTFLPVPPEFIWRSSRIQLTPAELSIFVPTGIMGVYLLIFQFRRDFLSAKGQQPPKTNPLSSPEAIVLYFGCASFLGGNLRIIDGATQHWTYRPVKETVATVPYEIQPVAPGSPSHVSVKLFFSEDWTPDSILKTNGNVLQSPTWFGRVRSQPPGSFFDESTKTLHWKFPRASVKTRRALQQWVIEKVGEVECRVPTGPSGEGKLHLPGIALSVGYSSIGWHVSTVTSLAMGPNQCDFSLSEGKPPFFFTLSEEAYGYWQDLSIPGQDFRENRLLTPAFARAVPTLIGYVRSTPPTPNRLILRKYKVVEIREVQVELPARKDLK